MMTMNEIERLARDSRPLPERTPLPDLCCYEAAAALWMLYRQGAVTREEAHRRKCALAARHAEWSAAVEMVQRLYAQQQDNIRRCGLLRSQIAKTAGRDEKLRLCIEAIGAMTGDTVFVKTENEKLEKEENS